MARRTHDAPGALGELDPLQVPLPNGTEVTTRVDRVVEGRVVTQGAVGRVVAQAEGAYDVQLVGVGVVRFARDQLRPRKVGQARYAQRRAGAWAALHPGRVVETVVGSRAWGLADEHSDTDLRGVFALPAPWTAGLAEPPRDLVSADGSETYWEVSKAMRQALRADPNTLEALFLPEALALDEIGEWLLAGRQCFVSREIYGAFGRYALSQLARLQKSQRLAERVGDVLPWIRASAAPTLEVKRSGERAPLPAPLRERWTARLQDAFTVLDAALAASPLPEAPPEAVERDCEDWLVATRLAARD